MMNSADAALDIEGLRVRRGKKRDAEPRLDRRPVRHEFGDVLADPSLHVADGRVVVSYKREAWVSPRLRRTRGCWPAALVI